MAGMNDVIWDRRMPSVVKALGGRGRDGRSFRMTWGELSFGCRGWAIALCLFEEGFAFNLHALRTQAFVELPMLRRWAWDPHDIMESWGVKTFDGAVHLNWGDRTKILDLPWRRWDRISDDVRRGDGSWVPYVGSWEVRPEGDMRPVSALGKAWKEPDGRHIESYPYRYLLTSGEVQERTATIFVQRDVRRLRMLRWTRLFQRVQHYIGVQFSDEVGERSGSWKGGTIGCSYELRPDETPRECLKRMERERRFK